MVTNDKKSCLYRLEDELLHDVHGQAGEGNGKDTSPGSSVSTTGTKVNWHHNSN
jgi:hypothetical protein